MILSFSASVEKFEKELYLKAVQEAVRECFMKAGQRFLLAAIPRIPVWTGMLRGAFRNAEDLFGKVSNDKSASGGVRIRGTEKGSVKNTPATSKIAYYYPPGGGRIQRTPQAGRQFSTESTKIIDISGATLATGRAAFYFKFEVNITYFDLLDAKRNWNAWKAGSDALESYIKANLTLPDPLKYTTRKLIKSS